jgi:uncharacterized RDD family membrane protein YckC
MKKSTSLDPIDRYVEEINALLPYPEDKKRFVLEQLKEDVIDAMGSDKRPPSVVFGSPKDVAINLSISQDWGISKAGWLPRTLAFLIDFLILTPILIIFLILPLLYLFPDPITSLDRRLLYIFVNLFVGVPSLIIILIYFAFLEKNFSTTIGKKGFGLIVIHESGIKITWSQAILRNLTKTPLTGLFLILDVLIGMFAEKTRTNKQRVFDLVAGTLVVNSIKNKQG